MSAAKEKERAFIIECINLYRDLPSLWNMKSKVYHDRDRKSKDYDSLVRKYNEMFPDAIKEDVKKKFNTLRTNYRKELRKYEQCMASGAEYEPTLWYFNEMNFLQDQKIVSDSECSIDPIQTYPVNVKCKVEKQSTESQVSTLDDYEDSSDGDVAPHPAPQPAAKRIKKEENPISMAHERRCEQKDEFYYWAMACAADLRSMERTQQLFAKKAIAEILMEGQFGQLHRNSVKINESPF